MKPIEFPEQNEIYAKNQPPYRPLPVYKDNDGCLTSCWKLTWKERFKILFTGKIWLMVLTFNHPLQPQKLQIDKPL